MINLTSTVLSSIGLFAILCLQSGCAEVVDNSGSEAAPSPAGSASPAEAFNPYVEETSSYRVLAVPRKFNQYCVELLAGAKVTGLSAEATLAGADVVTAGLGPEEVQEISECDLFVKGGSAFRVGSGEAKSQAVQIPKDLRIEALTQAPRGGDQTWELKTDGRLFLGSGAVLVTHGKNTLIEARELIFDHAVIETFEPESVPAVNQRGQDGGNLQIRALRMQGSVTIEMRGQKGGPGTGGSAGEGLDSRFVPRSGGPGARGAQGGASGNLIVDVPFREDLNFQAFLLPGAPGEGGAPGAGAHVVLPGCAPEPPSRVPPRCYVPDEHLEGAPGERGPQGLPGFLGTCADKNNKQNSVCTR